MDQLYKKWLEYKTAITESPNTIKRHKQHYRKYFEGTELFVQIPVKRSEFSEMNGVPVPM